MNPKLPQKRLSRLYNRGRPRRERRFLSHCLRAELIPSGKTASLPGLEKLDDMELYWHPVLERWGVYRRAAKGTSPASDLLYLVMRCQGSDGSYRAPGNWVLDLLRKHDTTRNGSLDPRRARREYIEYIEKRDELAAKLRAKRRKNLTRNVSKDIAIGWVGRVRSTGGIQLMDRPKAGTKRIYGKSQERRR